MTITRVQWTCAWTLAWVCNAPTASEASAEEGGGRSTRLRIQTRSFSFSSDHFSRRDLSPIWQLPRDSWELDFPQVYEISMSTVIKMECDDCSKGKFVEKETISHIREKVGQIFPVYVQEVQPGEQKEKKGKAKWKLNCCFRLNSDTARKPLSLLSSMSLARPGATSFPQIQNDLKIKILQVCELRVFKVLHPPPPPPAGPCHHWCARHAPLKPPELMEDRMLVWEWWEEKWLTKWTCGATS